MTRFLFNTILTISLCGVLLSCESSPDTTEAPPAVIAVDVAAERAAIEALSRDYLTANRAGDHAKIAALYADDALLLPADKPAVRGRAGVDAYLAANDSEPVDITFSDQSFVVAESGELAYEIGSTTRPNYVGKYLTIWRKIDGQWRIVVDSWNGDAPAMAGN